MSTAVPAMHCPFCLEDDPYITDELVFARFDQFPVSAGHTLIVPRRHVSDFFELTLAEQAAMIALLPQVKASLDRQFRPDGYNVGLNVGECAGQTIAHAHLHVIPRYRGDVSNPRGGVRGVIPEKQSYDDT